MNPTQSPRSAQGGEYISQLDYFKARHAALSGSEKDAWVMATDTAKTLVSNQWAADLCQLNAALRWVDADPLDADECRLATHGLIAACPYLRENFNPHLISVETLHCEASQILASEIGRLLRPS